MILAKILMKLRFISDARKLQWYPPYAFMGVKIRRLSKDYRQLHLEMPQRWYGTNLYGSVFGGFLTAVSDPIAPLMCEKIFPGTRGFTKRLEVDFLKPARGRVQLHFRITDQDLMEIQSQFNRQDSCTHPFEFQYLDERGRVVAQVKVICYMRLKA